MYKRQVMMMMMMMMMMMDDDDDDDDVLTLLIAHFPEIWPVLTRQPTVQQKAPRWKKANRFKRKRATRFRHARGP